MLVFIQENDNPFALKKTLHCLQPFASNFRIIPLSTNIATQMFTALANYDNPFFLTFRAGDQIKPNFFEMLENWIVQLSDDFVGVMIDQEETFQFPFVWRTQAVKEIPIDQWGFIPFEHYVLNNLQYRLSQNWKWKKVKIGDSLSNSITEPAWMKRPIEWDLIQPFLSTAPYSRFPHKPIISIVICTYNDAKYLSWAIHSVSLQSNPNWELIIVDDASTDDTRKILTNFDKNKRYTILRNEKNLGKAQSLNHALRWANGDWLLELDADDWLSPDCIKIMLDHVNNNDQAVLYYGDYYEWIERWNQQLIYQGVKKNPETINKNILLSEATPIAPRMYQTSVLKKHGGWSTKDPFGGRLYEDFQMLISLEEYPIKHISRPLYHRRIRKDSITHKEQKKFLIWKSWF